MEKLPGEEKHPVETLYDAGSPGGMESVLQGSVLLEGTRVSGMADLGL